RASFRSARPPPPGTAQPAMKSSNTPTTPCSWPRRRAAAGSADADLRLREIGLQAIESYVATAENADHLASRRNAGLSGYQCRVRGRARRLRHELRVAHDRRDCRRDLSIGHDYHPIDQCLDDLLRDLAGERR